METHIHDFSIRVLVCHEDGGYVAHALEMDIIGFGSTRDAAVKELESMIEAQISFARRQKDESLVLFPAEKALFERWEKANQQAIRQSALGDQAGKLEYLAATISFKNVASRSRSHSTFQPENELAGT